MKFIGLISLVFRANSDYITLPTDNSFRRKSKT